MVESEFLIEAAPVYHIYPGLVLYMFEELSLHINSMYHIDLSLVVHVSFLLLMLIQYFHIGIYFSEPVDCNDLPPTAVHGLNR